MVGVGGFEPPTFRLRRTLWPLPRIEEELSAREAMVGVGGFEPPTSRSRTVRSSLTELHPDGTYIVYEKTARGRKRCGAFAAPIGRGIHWPRRSTKAEGRRQACSLT